MAKNKKKEKNKIKKKDRNTTRIKDSKLFNFGLKGCFVFILPLIFSILYFHGAKNKQLNLIKENSQNLYTEVSNKCKEKFEENLIFRSEIKTCVDNNLIKKIIKEKNPKYLSALKTFVFVFSLFLLWMTYLLIVSIREKKRTPKDLTKNQKKDRNYIIGYIIIAIICHMLFFANFLYIAIKPLIM